MNNISENFSKIQSFRKTAKKCQKCGDFFPNKPALKIHYFNKHGEMVKKCPICSKKFLRLQDLKSHNTRMHPTTTLTTGSRTSEGGNKDFSEELI